MRYFLELSYSGTGYNGWQRQPDAPSVQQTLEEAVGTLTRLRTDVTGAGRTDTGVHASYYVAHFDTPEPIDDKARFVYKLNAILPDDIAIRSMTPVSEDAHARFSAVAREYKYYISRAKNPFGRGFCWQYYVDLDIEAMNRAATVLTETDDFTSFAKLHSANKTNICHVTLARWQRDGDLLTFTISADRFLRNMVRAITGTLVDVGRGKITEEEFRRITLGRDLSMCGGSAPACGLYLSDIKYPDNLFRRER